MDNPYAQLDEELSLSSEDKKKAAEENEEMQKLFRKVFNNYDGKKVLNVILNDLKLFDVCADERSVALRNYATYLIMTRMGYNDTVSMIDNLFNCKHE